MEEFVKRIETLEEIAKQQEFRLRDVEKTQLMTVEILKEFKEAHKEISKALNDQNITNERVHQYFEQFKSYSEEQNLINEKLGVVVTKVDVQDEKIQGLKRWIVGIGTGASLVVTALGVLMMLQK